MKVEFIRRTNIDSVRWNELNDATPESTVQTEFWYIDILTNHHWSACVAVDEKSGQWLGALPLNDERKLGFQLSRQPLLSKYWGILIPKIEGSTYQQLHLQNKIMQAILSAVLPKCWVFDYFTLPGMQYMPAYRWCNVANEALFTSELSLLQGMDSIRKSYSKTVRKKIRKLEKEGFANKFRTTYDDIEEILESNEKAGRKLIPSKALIQLKMLSLRAYELGNGFFMSTTDPDGSLAAAGFFVHNEKATHFISGYVKPEYRSAGAMTLLVDGAIENAAELSHRFDFFGSNIESIESFFRSFGSYPRPYFHVYKKKFPFTLL